MLKDMTNRPHARSSDMFSVCDSEGRFDSLSTRDDLMVISRVNDDLGLLLDAIRNFTRRTDALTDDLAKLRSARADRDDEAATD
jgi:hypothetical protein